MDVLTNHELEFYRGKRWLLERDHQDFGLIRLHQFTEGNATAAAEFLGFKTHDAVARKWNKIGLTPLGRENPRVSDKDERSVELLDRMLLERSLVPEYAYIYDWDLPNSMNTGRIQTFADIHLGDKNSEYHKFIELIEWVKERSWVRWIAPGDIFNVVTKQSVGNSADENITLEEAIRLAEYKLKPIAWQCIGIGHGNHDSRILRDAGVKINPVQILADKLRVAYLGYHKHMIINIGNPSIGKQQYTVYYHHGKGAANTKGGKVNASYSLFHNTTAELIITAHNHFEFSAKERKRNVITESGEVGSITRFLVSCPSFLDYGGYAEEKGFAPESTGTMGIELSAHEHHIRIVQ